MCCLLNYVVAFWNHVLTPHRDVLALDVVARMVVTVALLMDRVVIDGDRGLWSAGLVHKLRSGVVDGIGCSVVGWWWC